MFDANKVSAGNTFCDVSVMTLEYVYYVRLLTIKK